MVTFSLVRALSESGDEDCDKISPMDPLMVVSAVKDSECRMMFTSDISLMSNSNMPDEIVEWRESRGFPEVEIRGICGLVGGGGADEKCPIRSERQGPSSEPMGSTRCLSRRVPSHRMQGD